jgi:hypothetical protein
MRGGAGSPPQRRGGREAAREGDAVSLVRFKLEFMMPVPALSS